MNTNEIMNQITATKQYLVKLEESARAQIQHAIDEAVKVHGYSAYFSNIDDWMRAPFGFAPSVKTIYETILKGAATDQPSYAVFESVMGGCGHSYDIPTEIWKTIAENL